jgi:hypothetical protein
MVDKVELEQFSSEYFGSVPIFIPPIAPQSPSSMIWGWYNRPIVAAAPSGLSLAPLRINKNRTIKIMQPSLHMQHFTVFKIS